MALNATVDAARRFAARDDVDNVVVAFADVTRLTREWAADNAIASFLARLDAKVRVIALTGARVVGDDARDGRLALDERLNERVLGHARASWAQTLQSRYARWSSFVSMRLRRWNDEAHGDGDDAKALVTSLSSSLRRGAVTLAFNRTSPSTLVSQAEAGGAGPRDAGYIGALICEAMDGVYEDDVIDDGRADFANDFTVAVAEGQRAGASVGRSVDDLHVTKAVGAHGDDALVDVIVARADRLTRSTRLLGQMRARYGDRVRFIVLDVSAKLFAELEADDDGVAVNGNSFRRLFGYAADDATLRFASAVRQLVLRRDAGENVRDDVRCFKGAVAVINDANVETLLTSDDGNFRRCYDASKHWPHSATLRGGDGVRGLTKYCARAVFATYGDATHVEFFPRTGLERDGNLNCVGAREQLTRHGWEFENTNEMSSQWYRCVCRDVVGECVNVGACACGCEFCGRAVGHVKRGDREILKRAIELNCPVSRFRGEDGRRMRWTLQKCCRFAESERGTHYDGERLG